MRRPPGPPIELGIEALNKQHLVRRHAAGVIPFVVWVCLDVPLLVVNVLAGVDQPGHDRDEVRLVDAPGVAHGQGVAVHGFEGLPHVDDAPAVMFGFGQEAVGFGLSVDDDLGAGI